MEISNRRNSHGFKEVLILGMQSRSIYRAGISILKPISVKFMILPTVQTRVKSSVLMKSIIIRMVVHS